MFFPCSTIDGFEFARWQVSKEGVVRKITNHKVLRGSLIQSGYVQMNYRYKENGVPKRKTIQKHNLVLGVFKPRPLPCLECDHRNNRHSRGDNYLSNLRWITRDLNNLFKPSRGYHLNGNGWQAQLRINGVQANLGFFQSEDGAKVAYLTAKAHIIQEKSEELITRLLDEGFERAAALDALNWTEDDVTFDGIFQFLC